MIATASLIRGEASPARSDLRVRSVTARPYVIPTDRPESDGTLAWDATTIVVVEITGGGDTGLGYSYTHRAAAGLIETVLAPAVIGVDPMAVGRAWNAMRSALRNLGPTGVG